MTDYIPRWLVHPQTVTDPRIGYTNPAVHDRELNVQPVDHKCDVLTTTLRLLFPKLMRVQNLKFVALAVPEIIGGAEKWAVPAYAHAPFSQTY